MLRVQELGANERKSQVLLGASSVAVLSRVQRWLPLAIFVASILVTVTFWKVLPSSYRANEGTDYFAFYEPAARNLLAGRGLTVDGNPYVTHPPGYALVLAAVFKISQALRLSEDHTLQAFAALCMALVSGLIFYLARLMWGLLPAVISAVLWMTYPFALWLTKQPNSELPFMVVFYAGLLLFWFGVVRRINTWPLYSICGFLLGIAMLIRPFAIGLGLVMALVVWLVKCDVSKHSRLLMTMAILIGNTAAVLPWELWAYSQTGKVILLGTVGVGGMRDGLTFGADRKNYRKESNYSPDVTVVMSDFRANLMGTETLSGIATGVAKEARAHPVGITKLFLLKAARSWYGTDSLRNEGWIQLIQFFYLLALLWSIRNVWRLDGMRRWFALSVLLLVLYFWVMSIVGTSLLRYTVPVAGLVFLLMAGTFSAARPGAKSSNA